MNSHASEADAILIEGLEVPCALGMSAAERRMKRPVRIDLEVGMALDSAGRTDRLSHTINYQEIHDLVVEVAIARDYRLVEALGDRICAAIIDAWGPVSWVRIELRKHAPIAGAVPWAGVRLLRRRGAAD